MYQGKETKITKHTFCNHTPCELIGKIAVITEVIPAIGTVDSVDYHPKWYWATVDGRQHKFQEGDLE
jgi:hypothetical protein